MANAHPPASDKSKTGGILCGNGKAQPLKAILTMFSMTFNTYRSVTKRLLQRRKEVSSKTEEGCYKDCKGELRVEK